MLINRVLSSQFSSCTSTIMASSASAGMKQLLLPTKAQRLTAPTNSKALALAGSCSPRIAFSSRRKSFVAIVVKSSADISLPDPQGEGVSLGTMKLPLDTDVPRFETLLFQWANSLCQGANVPLPLPLKIDKIEGGVRLGFVVIQDSETEVPVYIDCLVFPGSGDSGPIFKAIRNGANRDKPPPGEPRIMKSLLAALRKSVEIATPSARA